jgi:uncharacterized protein DUF3443
LGGLSMFAGCGGSSGSSTSNPTPNNTESIVVNAGPAGGYANGVFASVTICVPGSSNCQTINGVLVDTGSFGLRVLSSALGSLNGALPQQKDSSGNSILECAQFVNSVLWGPVVNADVGMAGEKASSIPVQVIDASSTPIAAGCKAIGPAEEDLTSLGANGILGIGFFIQDCGGACAVSGSSNPGFYYSCAGSTCHVTGESGAQQVQNPVAHFSHDANGVMINLPSASAGAPSLSGSLVFGIGTQDNNGIGSAQTLRADSFGNLKTNFKNQTYSGFIDSGSNAYFFLDSSATGMPDCPNPESGFYCPSSPVNLSASNSDGSTTNTVNFTIGNASQMFSISANFVFPTLGGPNPSTFDWGLPFFFGRKVFVGIEAPAGSGPFWAY